MIASLQILKLVFSTGANYIKVCSIFRSHVQITDGVIIILRKELVYLEKFRQIFLENFILTE